MSEAMAWFDALLWWQQGLLILGTVLTAVWGLMLMEGLLAPQSRCWYWGGK